MINDKNYIRDFIWGPITMLLFFAGVLLLFMIYGCHKKRNPIILQPDCYTYVFVSSDTTYTEERCKDDTGF